MTPNRVIVEDHDFMRWYGNVEITCASQIPVKFFFENCQGNIETPNYTSILDTTLVVDEKELKSSSHICGYYFCYGYKTLNPPSPFIAKISYRKYGKIVPLMITYEVKDKYSIIMNTMKCLIFYSLWSLIVKNKIIFLSRK